MRPNWAFGVLTPADSAGTGSAGAVADGQQPRQSEAKNLMKTIRADGESSSARYRE
jgi:hypothetical protein